MSLTIILALALFACVAISAAHHWAAHRAHLAGPSVDAVEHFAIYVVLHTGYVIPFPH